MNFSWRARRNTEDRFERARKPRKAVAALAIALLAGGVLTASPATAAPGDPFDPADPLVFVAQGLPTGLYQAVTDSSGTVNFQAEGPTSPITYNAIAYNPADDYIYAIASTGNATYPNNSLLRIGQNGTLTRVGTATYPAANTGAFAADGLFYTTSSAPGYTTLTAINVTTGAVARTVTTSQAPLTADFTFADGYLWGQAVASGASQIVRINPTNGVVNFYPAPFFLNGGTDFSGAAWTFGNGNLGFSQNASGTVTQVAVTNPAAATPTFTLVSRTAGPASGNNDGTASSGQPTDLSIVKTGPAATVPAGGTVTYRLTVTNNGPGNSSGFVVNDTLPAELTNVATTSDACTVTGNDVQCVGGRLVAGDSVTYTVTATVPAGTTASVENTATVTSNEEDPTPGNNTSTTTAEPADISLVKRAGTPVDVNGNGLVDVGDTIQFTFDVENTGEIALSSITVDDPKVGAVACPQATLAAGASQTCAAATVYTITQADVDAGSVENTATASGTTPDGQMVTSEPSSTSTPTTAAAPAISVVKSAAPSDADSYEAGQVIDYNFVVTNTGNVPMNDVTVVEGAFSGTGDLPETVCPATTLAAGAQFVCTTSYTLTQADVDNGELTNTATAEGTPAGGTTPVSSSPSTVTIPSVADPSLTVVKSSDVETIVAAGQPITYSFVVTNTGNVTLDGIVVDDTAFSGAGELSAIDCPTDALVPGQITTCTAEYTVEQTDVDSGELTNTAVATGTTPDGGTVPSEPSTEVVPVDQSPALSVVKTADVVAAEVGQTVTYSFLVTNTGNVTITDPTVNEVDFSGTGELSEIICPDEASLAPGEEVTCEATYVVTQADIDAGEISNTATVTGTTPGGDPTEPSEPSTEIVTTDRLPALSVVKTADLEEVTTAGQVVTYSFVVANIGNVTLTDPTVNEGAFTGNGELSAVECPPDDLAPGESITCTASYTVVAADLADGGELSNTATASAITPGGDPITSDPSTVTVDEVAPAAPGTGGGLAGTGGTIAWSAAGIALMLIVAGGVIVYARRRSEAATEA